MSFDAFRRPRISWSISVYLRPRLQLPPSGRPDVLLRADRFFRLPGSPHTRTDPFLFAHESRLHLLYEAQVGDDYGRIVVDEIDDTGARRIGTVLTEPFDLSHPAIVRDSPRIYMLPESRGAGQLRLYRFDDFPSPPVLVRVLAEGGYVGSSPVRVDGIWYIFATDPRGLELFFTDDLERGTVRSHPCNPLTGDPRFHRCGGLPLWIGGDLIRPPQNGARRYGENLSLMAIEETSPNAYREEPGALDVLPCDGSWNANGSHHVSVCDFAGGVAVAIDGQASDPWYHKPLIRTWMIATGP